MNFRGLLLCAAAASSALVGRPAPVAAQVTSGAIGGVIVSDQTGPGLSGGGANNRYNNIQIDGATESDLFALGSTGQPGGQASGKSIGRANSLVAACGRR